MNSIIVPKRVMILSGEPSGDFHGSRLVRELKRLDNSIVFSGIGGDRLADQGVRLFYNIDRLSAMGLTEVIGQFGQIKKAFDLFRTELASFRPDLIILVDYPGFNLKAAKFAKAHYQVKILYYITPKVWAWKKSRLKSIRKYTDHAALILPFEEKIYRRAKIACTYVGNPLMDEYPEPVNRHGNGHKVSDGSGQSGITIGLLPGSRKSEIKNLLKIMVNAGLIIHEKKPKTRFLISMADCLSEDFFETIFSSLECNNEIFEFEKGPVKNIFQRADLVIAASGTVTLEAALCRVPTIIIYKMSYISYRIAKIVVRIKYAGLANLIAGRMVMPELLQYDATPGKIAGKALYMLDNLLYFENKLDQVRTLLGRKGAAVRTARIALDMLCNLR